MGVSTEQASISSAEALLTGKAVVREVGGPSVQKGQTPSEFGNVRGVNLIL